ALLVVAVVGIGFWLSRSQPGVDLHLRTTIRTEPGGALVVLGDHTQKSPATFADLEARKYNLRIMSPGSEAIKPTVTLDADIYQTCRRFDLCEAKVLFKSNRIYLARSFRCEPRTAKLCAKA